MNSKHCFIQRVVGLLALASLGFVSTAWGQANLMPDREAFMGTPVVVWGNTTVAGGTAYSIDFGDGSPTFAGAVNVNSQSWIATTHTYTATGSYTVTFTANGFSTTGTISVIDATTLSASQLEDQQINNAIQDGLRYLYWATDSREARHDAGWMTASWQGHGAFTSMATLAFENHGHTIGSGDVFSPMVQGGLNFVFGGLVTQAITAASEPGDPCVGLAVNPCNGLRPVNAGSIGYSTSIVLLAIAGSQSPGAVVGPGLGASSGMTYQEVAQRVANTVVWGQADPNTAGWGGWQYGLDNGGSDGSAVGWNVLGLLDAAAFGATIPAHVGPELEHEIAQTTNATGSMGYTVASSIPNTAKTGVRLSALSLIGVPLNGTSSIGTVTPQASVDYINDGWNINGACSWGSAHPSGGLVNGHNCIYSMFNVFKGLKLYGVSTLPAVPRADTDWHKFYQMYLVGIQTAPNATTGGSFSALQASGFSTQGETALALLVLSPTALILPDPVKFATIGLGPVTATNILPDDDEHTVTAHAEGACAPEPCTGADVPGATVDFEVLTGPNTGASGSDVTDSSGNATFTYTNTTLTVGTDTIQASIGNLNSNIVEKVWRTCVDDLSVTEGTNELQLDWTDTSPAGGYNVYRSTSAGGPYAFVANTTSATYLDTGLTNGVTYYYVVREVALNGDEFCQSNEASSTPVDPDSDGDGVNDDIDQCPDTPEGEVVNENGCSIAQLAPCDGDWKNHGKYVSAVAHAAEDFLAAGLITEEEKDAIVSAAAKSKCGKKK